MSCPDQAARRDVRHAVEERVLEGVDSEGPGAGLERPGKNAVIDREAPCDRAAASYDLIERKRILSRGRHRCGHHSETTGQLRSGSLDHDDMFV